MSTQHLPTKRQHVLDAMKTAHQTLQSVNEGANASYIPYLASVPSNLFGIALAFTDGEILEVGDTRYDFAMESISKVFTLACVLEEMDKETFKSKIGSNASSEPFNSVIDLELHDEHPYNPFDNAGAIATVGLIGAASPEERWNKIIGTYNRFAGRELTVNDAVYRSESDTNAHNRGISWLLKSSGSLQVDPDHACDIYTRQCSVAITCRDLAIMGGTLANRGIHPVTGKRVIKEENVPPILAEMMMNGMYENTGNWLYSAGLPGKSGVGGGILAIVPGICALAAFAPPLDVHGNSVRGQKAGIFLSEILGWNLFKK